MVNRFNSFRLDEDVLFRQLGRIASPRYRDLLRIAMYVYTADRLTKRNGRVDLNGPSRCMPVIQIPVSEPDFWNARETHSLLRRTIEFVTCDTWDFQFTFMRPEKQGQWWRAAECDGAIVCLDSGGLDSAAGLANRLLDWKGDVFAVTARHQEVQRQLIRDEQLPLLRERFGRRLYSVMVPTTLRDAPPMNRQEVTQRSRSFLFAALGGVVAGELGVDNVEVYENGIGVINLPPMTGMLFGSRATRSAHPEFFRRMSALLTTVSERPIDFALPFRNKTKAELIECIASDALLADVARRSASCIHYPRRVLGKQKQCGVCPGCIGRRQAMITGGIRESPDKYRFDIFGDASEVDEIPAERLGHLKTIISQIEFLSSIDAEVPLPLSVRAHFANVLDPTDDLKPTIQLLQKYRNEWLGLIEDGIAADRYWARWHGPVSSSATGNVA